MSHATLYDVFKTKKTNVAEFRNGYGSAPPVWDWLCQKYLDVSYYGSAGDALWKLAYDPRVPLDVRLCHAFTFDYAVVPAEHFQRMSQAAAYMDETLKLWPKWDGCVNHWGAFSEFFKTHKVTNRCLGVGMRCTSVCDVWDSWPRYGKDRMFDCVGAVLKSKEKEVSDVPSA